MCGGEKERDGWVGWVCGAAKDSRDEASQVKPHFELILTRYNIMPAKLARTRVRIPSNEYTIISAKQAIPPASPVFLAIPYPKDICTPTTNVPLAPWQTGHDKGQGQEHGPPRRTRHATQD